MESAGAVYLVGHGFPKETLGRIAIITFPIIIGVMLCIGKWVTGRRRENKVMMICIGYGIINMILFTIAIYNFNRSKETGSILLIALNFFLHEYYNYNKYN